MQSMIMNSKYTKLPNSDYEAGQYKSSLLI